MKILQTLMCALAAFLATLNSGCMTRSEDEMRPFIQAIERSGRDKLNLPGLPPIKFRKWIKGYDNKPYEFSLIDLRNRNYHYTFQFKPSSDGTFRLISEKGLFEMPYGAYTYNPERMVRSDYIYYKFLYNQCEFDFICYFDSVYTPSRFLQEKSRNIEMQEALEYINDWNSQIFNFKEENKK